MHTLVVFAHPEPDSLTGSTARRVADLVAATPGHTAEVADLTAEGFHPTFTAADLKTTRTAADAPADVRREQERVERADHLVLVFPVYWWAFPALLKGWVDRVFTNGWAYGKGGTALVGRGVHLVALAGADADMYERHGYDESMRVAIDHGIFEYSGTRVTSSRFLHEADNPDAATVTGAVDALVADLTSAALV
ncbi:NAD(P)H-dependent oxidoreductase [Actinosynnema pretiosum subsp. pretiosum]|uniref:NAD(P)H dehydrogenase (Quinone) n=2 Tax=Actinosynnema TaxID=40566 RepID=C6W9S1_ACTMD|nr:NAD(P)H-dependent oxidoreductase [Actinosynnema mirum]ACU37288.1 NAD(P)H dehydrogenase (quinone) [Actinosynnema mirum DSM 43827]AXX30758.1 NAD(P)H oxidoreductase YRKL [Actinosynnema pretiosum subsp. pretiosum]QUF05126.1 NAD(P)H-dependent oxidoreductase [Actinosynnema pretiosum subsp. pretiosum]